MSEQIKKSDVSEKDIYGYVIESAKIAEKQIADLNLELKKSAEISKGILSKTKFTDSQSIKEAEKQIKLANIQMIEAERLENNLIKVKADRIKAERLLSTEIEREAKATEKSNMAKEKSASVYARVDKWLGALVREYRELAVRQQLGAKLTDAEIKRMDTLSARITKYDQALKGVDATSGKHFRNVGNYKSAYNGLGNSVQQLSREMPAFANSMQTGFMAISNNLPIFFDEIQKLKQANVELVASGEPAKSIFKQLGSAIFSVGTLLSVGVTLLTVYGGEIVKWLSGETKLEAQLKARKDAQKKANEESEKARKAMFAETGEFVGYILALSKTNAGSKERIKMINEINKQYGTTLKNMSDEAMFQAQLNALIQDYIEFKKQEYKIKKNEEFIGLNLAKQDKLNIDLQKAKNKLLQQTLELQLKQKSLGEGVTDPTGAMGNLIEAQNETSRTIKNLEDELDKANTRLKAYGFNILDAKTKVKEFGFETGKTTNELEKQKKAYADVTDEIIRRFSIEEQAEQATKDYAITDTQKQLEDQLKLTTEYGKINNKRVDELLKEEEALRRKKIEEMNITQEERNFLLIELEDEMADKRRQIYADLELAQEEYAVKIQKKEGETLENRFKENKKFIDLTLSYFIKQSEEKIKQIDKEIQASEKQQSILEELAKNGNITAQQSLAENERITKEANERKLKEQKRIERLKLAQTAFDVYGKKVEAGDKNPLISTIKDIELLRAFINSLPAFESGTENTGTNGQGIDGKGGFLSVLHTNERVLTAEQNAKIGELSNIELAKVASDYNSGKIINLNHVGAVAGNSYDLIPLLSKLDNVENAIKNMPSNNIELGEITQHTMQIVQTFKRGNITNRRTYFIKK